MQHSFLSRALLFCGCLSLLLPNVTAAKEFSSDAKNHWAFQKLGSPVPPKTSDEWVQNPIDAFVLRKLGSENLTPAPVASRETLLRRASLDLTGLPPSPEELSAFLSDHSTEAFEKVVDRLLQSPHYGERWARHWLDLARYAESEGFKADETRPNAWRYRDYVIRSFNEDKPYDRFLMEQIAGDELWPGDPEALIATGFNRHFPDESNARNLMQRRQEILNDVTDTVGAVFTGLTFGCARCHDHKFDPILQKDYYRLQAFFANSAAHDDVPLASARALAEYNSRLHEWETATAAIREQMARIEAPQRQAIIDEYVQKYPAEIQEALAKKPGDRSPFECQMVAKAELYLNPHSHQYLAPTSAVVPRLKGPDKKRWEELNSDLKKFARLHPGNTPLGTGYYDISSESPKTYILRGGSYDSPTEEVQPGFLTLLNPAPTPYFKPPSGNTTGRRSALAKLLADPENPLTARVMVNRVWQHHFGKGLAASPSDLGLKGEPPSHPELLDWLARQFVESGWSMKKMHKLIMLSATYQQSANSNQRAEKLDPEDHLLWRYPRHRLEAEVIRDAALSVSGLLNAEMGGPSIFPELPDGMDARGGWKVTSDSDERNRRGIYIFVRRNLRYPMFETFDMPDTHESCSRRNCTTSPLQALTMLNNKLTIDWAEAFALRVQAEAGKDLSGQIQSAYELAYSRKPSPEEIALGTKFLSEQSDLIERQQHGSSDKQASNSKTPESAALTDFCHMLLNSNEFVYLN